MFNEGLSREMKNLSRLCETFNSWEFFLWFLYGIQIILILIHFFVYNFLFNEFLLFHQLLLDTSHHHEKKNCQMNLKVIYFFHVHLFMYIFISYFLFRKLIPSRRIINIIIVSNVIVDNLMVGIWFLNSILFSFKILRKRYRIIVLSSYYIMYQLEIFPLSLTCRSSSRGLLLWLRFTLNI